MSDDDEFIKYISSDAGLTSGNRMSELDLKNCPEAGIRISEIGIRKQYAV